MKSCIQIGVASMAIAALPSPGLAQASTTSPVDTKTVTTTPTATPLSEGEIRKVNTQAGMLTIQHGPLTNLHMPGMTMSFKVKDAAMLQQVKPGDKVRMLIENIDGTLTVTTLQKQS